MLKLYNDAESYWTAKASKERQEWLSNHKAIATRMRPDKREHYIIQQWKQYENKQYIAQSDVKDWISDINNLLYELRTRFWFAKHQKEFEKWDVSDLEKQIVDKFEQCCKAKELGDGIWLNTSCRVTEVARDTLRSLIAEMKRDRPPPQEPKQSQPPKAPFI